MKTTVRYLITAGSGLAIAILIFVIGGLFQAESLKEAFKVVCDGFFTAGVLIFGLGCLCWAGSKGAYDGLSYGFRVAFSRFTHTTDKNWRMENFGDYVSRKSEGRENADFRFLIFVGLGFIVLSLIALVIYYLV